MILESWDMGEVHAPIISLLTVISLNENLTFLLTDHLSSAYLYSLNGKRPGILLGSYKVFDFLFFFGFDLWLVAIGIWW